MTSVTVCASILLILSLANAIRISTPQGDIIGTTRKTLNGRKVYAFLGIPYAKPPVGELRFQNPVPFGSWEGVKDATEDGPICLQIDMWKQPEKNQNNSSSENEDISFNIPDANSDLPLTGSEDCLFLNVFTPSVAEPNKYPVMFNIHGGGFIGGGASSELDGPEFLLDKDVVMVSINYRVGALGFASTEDDVLSGNWGLKDQAQALKWVQENIASYGGNPNNVTIFGISAGGSSVHFQMISPLSKGLFHRAIAMGGSAHGPWAIKLPGEIAKRTKKLASFLDCPTEPSSLLAECLRKVPAERFIHMQLKFLVWNMDPMIVFTPVVEPKRASGAFLTESPFTAKSSVPMIIGVTKDEGIMKILLFQMKSSLEQALSELDENFQKYGSLSLGYDSEDLDTTEMMKEIRKFYFGEKKISRELLRNVINLYTDCWFHQGATSAIRNHEGPSYLYMFTYKGEISSLDFFPQLKEEDLGINHAEDSLYIFPYKPLRRGREVTGNDRKMLDTMVTMWTNFATHGNPTPEGSEIVWDRVSTSEMNYLNLNVANLKMEKNFQAERDQFWQQLLQKFSPFSKYNNKNIKTEL